MASLKFFLVVGMLVACAADEGGQITDRTRSKKDVLLSTISYPYVQHALPLVQHALPLVKTVSHIGAVNTPISVINPYYRTVYPYSYYPYYQHYPYNPTSVYYLKK